MKYFEILPNGQIFATSSVRTLEEVIEERVAVAKFFVKEDEESIELLQTGCGLSYLGDSATNNLSESIQMQNKIVVDNKITAKELINEYVDKQLEEKWGPIV